MQIVTADDVVQDTKNVGETLRTGKTVKQSLLSDDTEDGLNFTVSRTEWLPGANANTTPRHHHAFQQIRWAETGSVNYGPGQDIAPGDIAFFPRGAWYGPQLRDSGISLTIQFGFNGEKQHGSKFWSRYQKQAMEQLQARGTFERGLYIDIDPDTNELRERDAVDVLYVEQYALHTNRPFVIPAEGYQSAIMMHPKAFDFYKVASGVEAKQLGRFFDHTGPQADVRMSMLRLSDGGAHSFGDNRGQIAWTLSSGLEIEGKRYPGKTYIYCPRGEQLHIVGGEPVELFVVEFPRLD